MIDCFAAAKVRMKNDDGITVRVMAALLAQRTEAEMRAQCEPFSPDGDTKTSGKPLPATAGSLGALQARLSLHGGHLL